MTAPSPNPPSAVVPGASQTLGRSLADPGWLASLRGDAAAHAATRAMPTPSERPWKYLDISGLDLDSYAPAAGEVEISGALDRLTVATFSPGGAPLPPGLEGRLGSAIPYAHNRLTALHYALLQGGVWLEAPANFEAAAPIRLTRRYAEAKGLGAPHTLIVAGPNSRLTVVEEFNSGEGDLVVLPAVEILPGPGAEVRYIAIHRWGSNTRAFAEQRTITGRDSTVISLTLALGGAATKSHIHSSLQGRGSASELYGVTIGSRREHADVYTVQDHIGPDTRSDLLFKSALWGRSRSVYYGLTRVGHDARNANANQENRNLLLSKRAKADSDPVLEILTSNVIRASHGATAGPVDEEQLFYLQSRGIPYKEAEALLVRGFVAQVLARLPDEALREELAAVIDAKLEAVG